MSTFHLKAIYTDEGDKASVQFAMNQAPGVEAVYKVLEGSTMTYLKCFRSPQEQNLEMVRLLEEAGFKIIRTTSTFGAEHTEPVNGHWLVTFTD